MTDLNLPRKPLDRRRAGRTVLDEIALNLTTEPKFIDIRTLGTGHWVVEAVATTEHDARAIAYALNATWEVEADFRPGPLQNVIAWEGYLHDVHDVPVRVVAVIDHSEPLPAVTRHWEHPDDQEWKARELAEHPEAGSRIDAAIDAVHRLELAGAL